MKKWTRILFALCMVLTIPLTTVSADAVSQASDAKNMEKVLKFYKSGQIKKATKYSKKMNKHAKEKCVDKMSTGMKKAYKKVLQKWPVNIELGEKYLWDYYLTDIDNDQKTDLLVVVGSCEADAKLYVYQYKKKKAVKTASKWCGHTSFYAYPNHKGIIAFYGHMGAEAISVWTLKKGKIKEETVGQRVIGEEDDWFNLCCALKTYVKYDDDYNKSLDYSKLS